ncbi:MAG: ferredoxin family protein [Candidatus Atribacteria bacterium]|nr:ferredoxin family protein [Candidatus Atribacteria bacterium]
MDFKVKREEIPWYPTIDQEKCTGCGNCHDFCIHGVYSWNEEKDRPVIAHPYQCVVGCSGCRPQCLNEAINFPLLSILKEYR